MTGLYYWLQNRRIRLFLAIRYYAVGRVFRRITEPTLIDVLRGSACAVTDASELVKNIPLVRLAEKEIIEFKNDFTVVNQQLKSRYELAEKLRLAYPVNWAVEEQGAFTLYSLVRALKPQTVVETGVANGHSSFVILSALKTNGRGKLVSIDIWNDVGRLITAEEGDIWDLRLLSRPGARDELRTVLQSVAPVDLFMHDSEHLYAWQMAEYRTAAAVLSRSGILVSDDVDSSYAFWDFCHERGLKPAVLIGDRKALGLVCLAEGKQLQYEP
jgi:predicted O-methyltransferase YrrM